jgi:hypothetical protein
MQGRAFAVVLTILGLIGVPVSTYAAEAQKPIGRITASFGKTALEAAGAKSRPGDLYSAVNNEDRVVTDGGGVSILLASRVVLKMDAESAIRISEQPNQTMIVLEHGTVHVYVGQRPVRDAIVTLADANTRIECTQGVFLASYSDTAREGYYACEHGNVSLTATNEKKNVTLSADKQIVVKNHQSSDVVELDRVTFDQCKQYLERLDQITVAEGSNTFRMRSRTLDTQTAISQLAAAGWIDKAALARNTQAAAAANTDDNSTANSDSNTNNNTSSKKSTKSNSGNTGNSQTLKLAENTGNNPPAQNTDSGQKTPPPALDLPPVDVASNDTGASAPPAVDLGKNGNGPKDKGEKGGKDGVPASFSTPPVAGVPPVNTPPVNTPPVNAPPPVDVSGVGTGPGSPVVTAPPPVDVAPPVVIDVPAAGTPVANVPPIDIEGPGNGHGKGHGKGGDTVTLSTPPVSVAPPPVNIADVPNVNTVPVVAPPPVDLTPAPATTPPPIDVAALPPVKVPDLNAVDTSGKGHGKSPTPIVDVTPAPTPAAVPPVVVTPPVVVAPPVAVAPAPPIELPKVEIPVTPPVADVLPPPVDVSDVVKGTKGSTTPPVAAVVPPPIDIPKIDVPVTPTTPPPTAVIPPPTDNSGPGKVDAPAPDTTPVIAPAPAPTPTPDVTTTPPVTAPPPVIPPPTDIATPTDTVKTPPPTVVTTDNSGETPKSGKKKKK